MRKTFLCFAIIGLMASCNTSTESQTEDTTTTVEPVVENTTVADTAKSNFFCRK